MEALTIQNSIEIEAPASEVWDALVNPDKTQVYMFGCKTVSDWKAGSPLIWQMQYEGRDFIPVKGEILEIIPGSLLVYTVIDPHSGIADIPENYLSVRYELSPAAVGTLLTVTQGDYSKVADGARRYEESYNNGEGWNPILLQIKQLVEAK